MRIPNLWRAFLIHCFGVCPDCWRSLAWGQWNDGWLAGRPFCFNRDCPRRTHDAR